MPGPSPDARPAVHASARRPRLAAGHTRPLSPRPARRRRLPSGGSLSTVRPRSDVHGGLLRQGANDMGLFSNWFKGKKDAIATPSSTLHYMRPPERSIRYDPEL